MGLALVEIVMAIEDHFGIELPDAVVANCDTVFDLQRVIVAALVEASVPSADLDAHVYQGLTAIIVEVTGVAPGEIRPETRLFDVAKD